MSDYQIAMLALSGLTLIATFLVTRRSGPKPGKRGEREQAPPQKAKKSPWVRGGVGALDFPADGPVPSIAVEIDLDPGPQIVGVKNNPWKHSRTCGFCGQAVSSTLCPSCGEISSYINGMAVAHRGREPTWEEIVGWVQGAKRRG